MLLFGGMGKNTHGQKPTSILCQTVLPQYFVFLNQDAQEYDLAEWEKRVLNRTVKDS